MKSITRTIALKNEYITEIGIQNIPNNIRMSGLEYIKHVEDSIDDLLFLLNKDILSNIKHYEKEDIKIPKGTGSFNIMLELGALVEYNEYYGPPDAQLEVDVTLSFKKDRKQDEKSY